MVSKDKAPYRSQDTVERHATELAIIAEIGRLIGSTLNIDEVYERFAAEVRKLIPFDRINVNLKSPDGETFTIAYVSGFDIAVRRQGDKIPLAGTMTETLFRTRTGLFLHPVNEEEIFNCFPHAATFINTTFRVGMRSMMAVPLISRDEVIGVLHFRAKKPNAYTEADLRLAERIGAQIAGAIANAQLYSDLQKTEKSLRESEKRFRTLVEHAAVGIAEVEAGTGRFLAVNRMLCEMLGRTEEELLATTFPTITHPEDVNIHPNLSNRMYSGEFDHYSLEKRYLRKDGGVIWVNNTISRLWKPGETPGRTIIIIRDITERRLMEETLKETLDQLESRVRERTMELEETNTALRVLIKKGDNDQKRLEESLQSNINQLVMPFLARLKLSQSDPERLTYLKILEANLNQIVSPFINQLSSAHKNLTPKEIQIAEMVKQGKRSKEIAQLFGISVGTVITHRNNIRKKLNLKSRDANLRSHLLSLA